jgi:hypothetical protein
LGANAARLLLSLATFPESFSCQNVVRDLGNLVPFGQSCWCQKHPCTNITLCRDRKTRSGVPGSRASWSRYRYPSECTSRRTTISGRVSLDRIRAMCLLRCSGVSVSNRCCLPCALSLTCALLRGLLPARCRVLS